MRKGFSPWPVEAMFGAIGRLRNRNEGYTAGTRERTRVIAFKSRRKSGGGGGSRTPVRKALRHEAYMRSSIQLGSPATLRMSKKRSRLVRWFSPEPYGPKSPGQLTV